MKTSIWENYAAFKASFIAKTFPKFQCNLEHVCTQFIITVQHKNYEKIITCRCTTDTIYR